MFARLSRSQSVLSWGFAAALLLAEASVVLAQPAGPVPAPERDRRGRMDAPTLTVSGTGEDFGTPDRATVRLGAVAQAPQAAEAQKQVAEIVAKTIDAVKQLGIDEKSIRTAGVSLSPVYTDFQPRPGQQQPQEPRISGYRASNTIEVRLDDLAKIGPVIDAGVSTGANNVEGVDFQLKDDGPQRKAALKQAAADARGKAEALADAMGMRLAGVVEVIEGGAGGGWPIPMARRGAMMAESFAANTPIQPGQLQVTASVTITYRIAPVERDGAPEKPAP